jgi:hypothetical protein
MAVDSLLKPAWWNEHGAWNMERGKSLRTVEQETFGFPIFPEKSATYKLLT